MKIEGIVLAAGFSKRAGTHKMTLDFNGKTILESCIGAMYDTCSNIIVVGGYKIENIAPILKNYSKVNLVFNRNYEDGMFSSIKEGLRHITGERFFLIPGDYPTIKKGTYENLLSYDSEIVIPTYNGKKGHPVLIKSYLKTNILNDSKYSNLGEFIHEHEITAIDTQDPGILKDVDTKEDYNKLICLKSF